MINKQLVIIGGGPAGLAAAISAYDSGLRDILIIERESNLGGILNQCIHNGFGLHTFKEELTGPEYASRYIEGVIQRNIEYKLDTTVIKISDEKTITAVNETDGLLKIHAQAVILCCGCRERPRGAINIAGARCAGIYSAGTAQKLVNIDGVMPGKEVVILGSGDIGLIMARRMTFEGAKVKAVVELMPYSSGLNRNIVQCLNDFDIPLKFSTTVIDILGEGRLTGVVIAQVDSNLQPIMETAQTIKCDTLLLSVGLLPENELAKMANISLSPITGGAIVNEQMMTKIPGIFSCGNVLHVHDLVDFVSSEASLAGAEAVKYLNNQERNEYPTISVNGENGIRYVVPQILSKNDNYQPISLKMRVGNVYRKVKIVVSVDGKVIYSKARPIVTPGEMETITLNEELVKLAKSGNNVVVSLEK